MSLSTFEQWTIERQERVGHRRVTLQKWRGMTGQSDEIYTRYIVRVFKAKFEMEDGQVKLGTMKWLPILGANETCEEHDKHEVFERVMRKQAAELALETIEGTFPS